MHLTIPRGPIELAADLHLPSDFDEKAPLRAVVLSTPGRPPDRPGARHYEMYDVPEYVDAAVERLVTFYENHL